MEGGILNAETKDTSLTLHHDVSIALCECRLNRRTSGAFNPSLTNQTLDDLTNMMACLLRPMIGGRYVPKRDERAVRDAAVWQAFTGRNHAQVMQDFKISRSLLYAILARRLKN